MPDLWLGPAPPIRGPGNVPALRELPRRQRMQPDGALLSALRLRVRAVLPGAARGVRRPRRHLLRVRVFLVLLRQLAAPRQAVRRDGRGALRPRPGKPRDRGREQRWLPAPVLCREGGSRTRDRARGECRRGGEREGGSKRGPLLRRGLRSRPRRRRKTGRSPDRQQRPRPGSRPEELRPGHEARPRVQGRHHAGVSASASPDEGEPVRHDLPRALLLLLPDLDRLLLPRRGVDPLRRGGAVDARRLPARLCPPQRGRFEAGERGRGSVSWAWRGRRASTDSRPTPRSPSR